MMLVCVVALLGLLQGPAASEQIPVFLGPIPSPDGFVAGTERFKDSYDDLREELRKNREFQRVIRLVSDPSDAVLLVEISDRGLVDTGFRTCNAVSGRGLVADR